MTQYRITRDLSANGRVAQPVIKQGNMLSPSWLYVTKQYKVGDIVSGNIAQQDDVFFQKGKAILIKATTGIVTTNGVPYSGTAELSIPLGVGAICPVGETCDTTYITTKPTKAYKKNINTGQLEVVKNYTEGTVISVSLVINEANKVFSSPKILLLEDNSFIDGNDAKVYVAGSTSLTQSISSSLIPSNKTTTLIAATLFLALVFAVLKWKKII